MPLVSSLRLIKQRLPADVIVPFAVTRFALCLVGWLGFRLLPLPATFAQAWEIAGNGTRNPYLATHAHPFLNMWSRWDAEWYVDIAQNGYRYVPGVKSNTAFFPLYPCLLRAIHAGLFMPATYSSWFIAGIVVSNISLLIALLYLRPLLLIDFDLSVVRRAVFYLLIFPTSFFLSCVYPESLFLALSIAAFYYARTNRWVAAWVVAALAALTRSQGVIVAGALLVEYFHQREFDIRKIRREIAAFLLLPAAICLFAAFLYWNFGHWNVTFESQRAWHRQFMLPIYPIMWFIRNAPALDLQHHDVLDFSFLLFLLVCAIAALRRLRLSYIVYIWLALLFMSSWGTFTSVPRFALVVFPVFALLALIGSCRPVVDASYVTIAGLLLGVFMIMNSQWNWVA